MKKYTLTFIALFIFGQIWGQNVVDLEKESNHALVNKKAPEIKARTLSGKSFKLSDFKGKTVILHIWSLSCAACFMELPDLNKITELYRDRGVIIISMMDNTKDELIKEMLIKNESAYTLRKKTFKNDVINFQILPDAKALIKTYTSQVGFPQTFFINKDGIVKDYSYGYLQSFEGIPGLISNIDHLKEKIDKIINTDKTRL